MEEILEGIADNVATLVLAMSQTDRAFGNIVPGAELIRVRPSLLIHHTHTLTLYYDLSNIWIY